MTGRNRWSSASSPKLETRPPGALLIVLGAVGILGILGAVVAVVEPRMTGALERRLERRLRADVALRGIRPGLAGVELMDLEVEAPGGLRVEVGAIRVPIDLFRLARGAGSPIGRVRLRRVLVEGDPRSVATREWLRGLVGSAHASVAPSVATGDEPPAAGGSERDPTADWLPEVDLANLSFVIEDLSVRFSRAPDARPRPRLSDGRVRIDRSGRGGVRLEGAFRTLEEASVAARLELTPARGAVAWRGRGSVSVEGVVLDRQELADDPVPVPRVELAVDDIRLGERIALEGGRLVVGSELMATLTGAFERRPEGAVIRVEAEVAKTRCQGLVEAIPVAVLGDLSGLRLGGSFAAGLRLDLDLAHLSATELELRFEDECSFLEMPARPSIGSLRAPFRLRVPAASGGETLEITTGPGSERWVPLARISPYLQQAVLAHEDATFYRHAGFEPVAIRDSLVENLEAGRFERGASTISMQLAKNLYLSRDKVIARKVREALLTWWLEREMEKDEILALYLNVIEYGPNLYGIGPAARHYFDAEPAQLGPAEGAWLATLLPAPRRYYRSYERGALGESTAAEMRFLLEHMARKGRIGEDALAWGLHGVDSFRFGRIQPRESDPMRRLESWLGLHDGALPGAW